ncbi:hypothetical protein P7K49_001580 [Saguinus oedipus]|uniref:Uncharacterized protein n=1 Tax=Saguinus oedipus TaxID=9490 RepID=A0ABQ9WEW3_SAGOE|nr:hypothetical protein P7K49_001580 [Saguinus oedipus]
MAHSHPVFVFTTIRESDLPFMGPSPGPHPAWSADQGSAWGPAPHIHPSAAAGPPGSRGPPGIRGTKGRWVSWAQLLGADADGLSSQPGRGKIKRHSSDPAGSLQCPCPLGLFKRASASGKPGSIQIF